MVIERKGNIFTSKAEILVNTVNCEGIMGAGIAQEYKLRYPRMYEKYRLLCEKKLLDIGILWLYREEDRGILNFPTKKYWRMPSKIEYIEKGLQKFVETYKENNIKSIAFPLLGADKGGLSKRVSFEVMKTYLNNLDEIEIEIWEFDPFATDDLYEELKDKFNSLSESTIKAITGLSNVQIEKIKEAFNKEHINSFNSLLKIRGIGEKTLEKVLKIKEYKGFKQKSLFE